MQSGAGEGNRTPDLRVTNALLYRLSYTGTMFVIIYIIKLCGKGRFGRVRKRPSETRSSALLSDGLYAV